MGRTCLPRAPSARQRKIACVCCLSWPRHEPFGYKAISRVKFMGLAFCLACSSSPWPLPSSSGLGLFTIGQSLRVLFAQWIPSQDVPNIFGFVLGCQLALGACFHSSTFCAITATPLTIHFRNARWLPIAVARYRKTCPTGGAIRAGRREGGEGACAFCVMCHFAQLAGDSIPAVFVCWFVFVRVGPLAFARCCGRTFTSSRVLVRASIRGAGPAGKGGAAEAARSSRRNPPASEANVAPAASHARHTNDADTEHDFQACR